MRQSTKKHVPGKKRSSGAVAVDVSIIATLWGVTRAAVYAAVAAGKVKGVKREVGKPMLIPIQPLPHRRAWGSVTRNNS